MKYLERLEESFNPDEMTVAELMEFKRRTEALADAVVGFLERFARSASNPMPEHPRQHPQMRLDAKFPELDQSGYTPDGKQAHNASPDDA